MRVPISAHTLRWLRPLLGLALIIHALGHLAAVINAGIRIGASNSSASAQRVQTSLWLFSFLTALAVTALLSGGLAEASARQQQSAAFNSSPEATSDRLLWQPLPVRALRAE